MSLPRHSPANLGTCLLFPPPRELLHAVRLVVVLLAHAPQYALLRAGLHAAHPLLRSVRDAPSPLDGDLYAPLDLAALPGRAVGAAQPRLLDVLCTARVAADLALGAVGDAQAPLNDPVGALGEGALAPGPLLLGGLAHSGGRGERPASSRLVSSGCRQWFLAITARLCAISAG